MVSTYTQNNGVEKPGIGEQSNTWGVTANTNYDILDRAATGVGVITLTGASSNLSTLDGSLSDGQYSGLILSGAPGVTHTITVLPNDIRRTYFVYNQTGQSVVFTQGSGGNFTLANADSAIIYCDGAGATAAVINLADHLAMSSPKITGGAISGVTLSGLSAPLAVAEGGTGAGTAPAALVALGLTATAAEINILDGVTATAAEINLLDGVTASTAEINILDGVTATTAELNILDGATLTVTELNYVDGVTSAIQTQLDAKLSNATPVPLANGGTGAALVDPNADRILFWDDSAGAFTFLTVGPGLTITGTTIDAAATGWSLVETITTTSGTTATMVAAFAAGYDYMFRFNGVSFVSGNPNMSAAWFGATDAAWSSAVEIGPGVAFGSFSWGEMQYADPQISRKLHQIFGGLRGSNNSGSSSSTATLDDNQKGAYRIYSTAQVVTRCRFSGNGGETFDAGNIEVWRKVS